jgi:hypothetical protein
MSKSEGRGKKVEAMSNSENSLDPRIEKLVALLYGELPEAEAAQVRAMMDADAGLRAEYEELVAARDLLGELEEPAAAPSFVFLDEREPVRFAPGAGLLGRLLGRVSRTRTWNWAPWTVATAAAIVAIVAVTDLRLERQEGAIALRFGERSQRSVVDPAALRQQQDFAAETPVRDSGTGLPAVGPQQDVARMPGGQLEMTQTPEIRQVSEGAGPYLTKHEFDAYAAGMTQTLLALLNEYSKTRDQEVAGLLQAAIDGISEKQTRDYSDLRDRMDALRAGMAQEQFTTKAQLDALLGSREGSLSPSEGSSDGDGQEKEGGK